MGPQLINRGPNLATITFEVIDDGDAWSKSDGAAEAGRARVQC